MSSFKELNGPLGTDIHSFYKLGGSDAHHHPETSSGGLPRQTQAQSQSGGDSFIAFDQPIQKQLVLPKCGEQEYDHLNSVQQLSRAAMPDQTRYIFDSAKSSNLTEPISIIAKNSRRRQHQLDSDSQPTYVPISQAILQHPQFYGTGHNQQKKISPRVPRRYSKAQDESCQSGDEFYSPALESSVDDEQDDLVILKRFQSSVNDSHNGLARRRSSPDLVDLRNSFIENSSSSINNNSESDVVTSSVALGITKTTASTVSYPVRPSEFPQQTNILSKMAGNQVRNHNPPQQNQQLENVISSSSAASPLTPSKSCPKFEFHLDNDLHIDTCSSDFFPNQTKGFSLLPAESKSIMLNDSGGDCGNSDTIKSDSIDAGIPSSGGTFGLFSKTKTWFGLSSSSEKKEKVEISKKDLNVFAPTTF